MPQLRGEDGREAGAEKGEEGRGVTPLITKAVTFFPDMAADYKWFDISDIDHGITYTHKENMEGIRKPLPFEKCAIAGIDLDGQTFAVLVSRQIDGLLLVHGANTLANTNNLQVQIDPVFRIDPLEQGVEEGITILYNDKRFDDNELAKQVTSISVVVINTFLRGLDRQLVSEGYTPIKRSNHAKRIRQGKKPMFDWHTVVIEPRHSSGESLGGTHATPRLHDVRGHWVVRNNKRFWRKPHKRGDASKGVIFKDYQIKGQEQRA